MAVSGINQALAARIITYRDRKGPFKSIDELKHVGISYKRFGSIRMHFTTEDLESEKMSIRSNISPVSRSHSYLSTKSKFFIRIQSFHFFYRFISIPLFKHNQALVVFLFCNYNIFIFTIDFRSNKREFFTFGNENLSNF